MTAHARHGFRAGIVARMIGASVPILNVFVTHDASHTRWRELRALPPGSLGARTAAFLDKPGSRSFPSTKFTMSYTLS